MSSYLSLTLLDMKLVYFYLSERIALDFDQLPDTLYRKVPFPKIIISEVGVSDYWVPDILPLQLNSVPAELHRNPA